MKRKITLSIAPILGALLLLSLTSSDRAVMAQNQLRPVGDTGVVRLGPNQVLRVTVAAGDVNGDTSARVRFRQTKYEMCQASPKLCVASQTTTPAIMLAPNEAAIVDGADLADWRTEVLSNNRNVKVTGVVFDTSTQRVVTFIAAELLIEDL